MTPDYMEAESHKYTDSCFILLRLSSGKTALFNNRRELICIDDLRFLIERKELTTYIEPRQPRVTYPAAVPDLDLELDL